MLQIVSGKFFSAAKCYETLHRGTYYTNYRTFQNDAISTAVGRLLPSTGRSGLGTLTYEILEKIEWIPPATGVMTSTGGRELVDDFATVLSFVLNAICTTDPDLIRRLTAADSPELNRRNNPGKYLRRVFDGQILAQPEDATLINDFVTALIGLKRDSYGGAIRAIRRYVTATHRIADDTSLAYALFIMSIEALAQTAVDGVAVWSDYEETLLWQEDQKAILPEVRYAGIVFTMPRPLWRIFRRNRHLLHDLPVLGAGVIRQWVAIRFGVCPIILVMPHTFGGDLKFNPHLHILVSTGGLQDRFGRWLPTVQFNKRALMLLWRDAVINHLRRALKARILESHLSVQELEQLFTSEIERPFWITYIDQIVSKSHFAGYAGRYVRRLPVSLRRLSEVTKQNVEFLAKDTKARQSVPTRYSLRDFVALLAEHAPDHYRHGIRYFGLLAPRAKGKTWPGLFVLLNQPQRSRPRRLSWRSSIRKYFGVDPLMYGGEEMHWLRREEAVAR